MTYHPKMGRGYGHVTYNFVVWRDVARRAGSSTAAGLLVTYMYVHPPPHASQRHTHSYKIWEITARNFYQTLSDHCCLQQSTLWSFYPLWNSNAQNEYGVCQFSPTRRKSVTTATSLDGAVATWIYFYKAHWCLTFAESLLKISL